MLFSCLRLSNLQHNRASYESRGGCLKISPAPLHTGCRQGAEEGSTEVACHGPIPQAQFLTGLGAAERLQALLEAAQSDEEAEQLISGFERLVGGDSSAGANEQVSRVLSPSIPVYQHCMAAPARLEAM